EVIFKYHDRLESGDYDKEVVKEMKRRVGSDFDDVPLEKCASAIISQLARRDVWVVGTEVYEYKRAKVNVRETKGGIVLRNKKFVLDQNAQLVAEDVPQEALQAPLPNQPVRWAVLDGDLPTMIRVRQAGFQMTGNKKYPVFREVPDPRDKKRTAYVTKDDKDR